MKKLLCILDSLDIGGAETFLMKIDRSLDPKEYRFDFVVSKDGGAYISEIKNRGGRIFVVSHRRKNLYSALRDIKNIVKENNYDAVLRLGNSPILTFDLIAAKFGGAKHLAFRSCNAQTGLSWKSKFVNAIMRPILNIVCDVKIAPSKLAAEFTFGKRAAQSDVYILYNGVDLNVFHYDETGRNEIRNEFDFSDKFVVGHIGRLHTQKNHSFLINVFSEIRKKQPNAVLLLIGIGELEDEIRKQVKDMNLESYVVFAGIRRDIPQVLSAMDVFVFPSLHEGMPNTVIEAQSTGLPCVIADTITREANITGLVQYLSLNETTDFWAQKAIDAAMTDRKDFTQDFLLQGYDIQSVVKQFVSILLE